MIRGHGEIARHVARVVDVVERGSIASRQPVHDRLARSWERSLSNYRVDPGQASLPQVVTARELREHRLVVIGDGTRERINLYRVSVTFSRAWKEADLILGKGWRVADVLMGSSHQYTRDVVCYWHDNKGFHIKLRPHAKEAHKFSVDEAEQEDFLFARLCGVTLEDIDALDLADSKALQDAFRAMVG